MSIEQTREILSHEELSDADIVHLLGLTDPEECELLRKTAYDRTTELMGSFVYYRGLIEFSNICTASCRYCGIRRENHDVERYTMSKEEIVAAAKWAADQGYGSICLQSGERRDEKYIAFVESCLEAIHEATVSEKLPDGVGVTLSLGDGLRPGAGVDAGDAAQWEEVINLGQLAKYALEKGVQCMIEGPGHVPLNQVRTQIQGIKRLTNNAPLYVLGPLCCDSAPGYDHIAGAIGGALGMVKRNEEDDLLHELVEGMTGKKSIKALTYGEACKVIGELEGRQGTPPPRKSGKPLRKTAPGHTSEGQRRKVWALMYRLQDASPSKAPLGDRLCAIIKKELGMDAFPKDPFAWISYKDGNKLVEVLKGYVKTAQKSRGDADADG